MGVQFAKKRFRTRTKSTGLSTLGPDGITIVEQPGESPISSPNQQPKKRDPELIEEKRIQGGSQIGEPEHDMDPPAEPGREIGEMNEDVRILVEMYDLLGHEIERQQGRAAQKEKAKPARRASLEPRINQILNQQREMYKLMVGRKVNTTTSSKEPTPQINELIQLSERFFQQMTKDNEEIRQLISTQTTSKTVRRQSFVEALRRIKSVSSERRLSAAQNKIVQLKTILENGNIENALIQDVLDSRAMIERMHLENEQLHEQNENLESKSDNLAHELELLREQLKERDEQLDVMRTQMRLNEDQMRHELEVKLVMIQEMEEEIILLSEKLTERDDLHEIGHFMMSEMREQQLLETLEDTKAQLLETMDELEDVSDALHRESITNRELQQIIQIKDQKIKLLEMTMDDLRVAYDSNNNSTSINVNIDFNNSKVRASSIDYDNFGSERSQSQQSVEFGADIIQEILKATSPAHPVADLTNTPPAFRHPLYKNNGMQPGLTGDSEINFDDDEVPSLKNEEENTMKEAAEKIMDEDQRKRTASDGEDVFE